MLFSAHIWLFSEEHLPDSVRALVLDSDGTIGRGHGGQSNEGGERGDGLHVGCCGVEESEADLWMVVLECCRMAVKWSPFYTEANQNQCRS